MINTIATIFYHHLNRIGSYFNYQTWNYISQLWLIFYFKAGIYLFFNTNIVFSPNRTALNIINFRIHINKYSKLFVTRLIKYICMLRVQNSINVLNLGGWKIPVTGHQESQHFMDRFHVSLRTTTFDQNRKCFKD